MKPEELRVKVAIAVARYEVTYYENVIAKNTQGHKYFHNGREQGNLEAYKRMLRLLTEDVKSETLTRSEV